LVNELDITKNNGFIYSYSLGRKHKPSKACNTEPFYKLEKHEQKIRSGNGFVLNLSPDQAHTIYSVMQTYFHHFTNGGCVYNTVLHNCTHDIQIAIKKAGIDLYNFVPGAVTHFPSDVQRDLLNTKNNGDQLVRSIVQYPKGQDKGITVQSNKVKLLFDTVAAHGNNGWYEYSGSDLSENLKDFL